MKRYELFLTCPKGLESACKADLASMNIADVKIQDGGLSFKGTIKDIYIINLCSRIGMNLLVKIVNFNFNSVNDFYNSIYKHHWNTFIDPKMTFSIDNIIIKENSNFKNSQFINLKAKDAICDKIKKIRGIRPNIDKKAPHINIKIVIDNESCIIYANSSGKSLYVRGYKNNYHEASINESLASGLIFLSDWNKEDPLLDPMCGSGTICLEAAMIKRNIPPGIIRTFSFQNWLNYDQDLFYSIINRFSNNIDEEFKNTIFGSDINADFIQGAKETSQSFKFNLGINFKIRNITNLKDCKNYHIITNPPYQIRIGDKHTEETIHRGFKEILNNDNSIYLIYPYNSDFITQNYIFNEIAILYNGPIKCGFYRINKCLK